MNEVFADTSGWANYFVRTEPFHQNAKELMQQWYKDQTSVITTKFNQETSNFNNWGQSKINSNLVLEPTQKTALFNSLSQQTRGKKQNCYPLRGRPFTYIDPTEPVAVDDWETLQ